MRCAQVGRIASQCRVLCIQRKGMQEACQCMLHPRPARWGTGTGTLACATGWNPRTPPCPGRERKHQRIPTWTHSASPARPMTVPRASAGAAIAAALSCCTRSRCCAWFHSDQPRLGLPRLSSRARSACIVSADGCNPPAAPSPTDTAPQAACMPHVRGAVRARNPAAQRHCAGRAPRPARRAGRARARSGRRQRHSSRPLRRRCGRCSGGAG